MERWGIRCLRWALSAFVLGIGVHSAQGFNNSNLTFSAVTTNFAGVLEWPGDSGTNNTLSIVNGAVVTDTGHWFGGINGAANRNFVIISDPGSIWSNSVVNSFIGRYGGGNQVIVTNGGTWFSANALIGSLVASASNNSVLVTGPESLFRTTGDVDIGSGGVGNTITVTEQGRLQVGSSLMIGNSTVGNSVVITNGGRAYIGSTYVGSVNNVPGSINNLLQISGPGSLYSNTSVFMIGRYSPSNRVVVSDSAQVVSHGVWYIGGITAAASNNSALVTGSATTWSNVNAIYLGNAGSGNLLTIDAADAYGTSLTMGTSTGGNGNQLLVTNGGRLTLAGSLLISDVDGSTSNNTALVTGSGSVVRVNGNAIVGRYSTGNQMTVADGGAVIVTGVGIGYIGASGPGGSNNSVTVTGTGSVWSNSSTLVVGNAANSNRLTVSNGGSAYGSSVNVGSATLGNNVIVVDSGGVLDAGSAISVGSAAGNYATNVGGTYQFSAAAPGLTAGRVFLTDGTVSFRNVTTAPVTPLANLTYAGNNTFQLNSATNTSVAAYTFNTGTPTNYYRLSLRNGRFQATTTTFGANGELVGNGTVASANVTNHGTIAPGFSAGEITFTSNLVLGATSSLEMEIGGLNPADYDRLIVNGSLTLTGSLSVAMINAFAPALSNTFTLIDNTGSSAVSGHFSGLTNGAFIDASGNGIQAFFHIHYDGGTGNDVVLITTNIPEPGALALVGLSVALLLRRSQVKRNG